MDSTSLPETLKEKIQCIESELARIMPERIPAGWARQQSGKTLAPIDPLSWQRVTAPGRELLARGGKRWRPLLLLLSAEMYGDWRRALPLTPLVEIAHNGSLIADDIEDAAQERRGGRAVHLVYGLDLALNAGNLMYFLAAGVIDSAPLSAGERLTLHRYFLQDMVRLHLGQGLDILWHRDHENIPGETEYLEMCRLKTGGLSRLAARSGAIAGGAREEQAERLGEIAEDYGACFQIIDDVRNLTTGVKGKQRGDDIIEGKKSLPVILYLQRHPEIKSRLGELFRTAGGQDAGIAREAIDELIGLLAPSGCLQEASERAFALLAETHRHLERSVSPSAARDQLQGLVEALITG